MTDPEDVPLSETAPGTGAAAATEEPPKEPRPGIDVKVAAYSGPLDVLLDLIRAAQVNIHDIPIREITASYLQVIEAMKRLDIEVASEFLVMAATLIQIKSRMILPAELEEGEGDLWEDPRRDLVRQLLEYQKFKELSAELERREAVAHRLVERRDAQAAFTAARGLVSDLWKDVSLEDLLKVFTEVVRVLDYEEFGVLREEEFKVDDKMDYIRAVLADRGEVEFYGLFSDRRSRAEIVVTFWAVLELYKVGAIKVQQQEQFALIMIFPRDLSAGLPTAEDRVAAAEAAESDLEDLMGPAPEEAGTADEDHDG